MCLYCGGSLITNCSDFLFGFTLGTQSIEAVFWQCAGQKDGTKTTWSQEYPDRYFERST
jgi:hypothetical protein